LEEYVTIAKTSNSSKNIWKSK